jgi:hypothetical protein
MASPKVVIKDDDKMMGVEKKRGSSLLNCFQCQYLIVPQGGLQT